MGSGQIVGAVMLAFGGSCMFAMMVRGVGLQAAINIVLVSLGTTGFVMVAAWLLVGK